MSTPTRREALTAGALTLASGLIASLSARQAPVAGGRIVTKGVEVDKDVAAELKQLRKVKREYERLKIEHELLKKAIEFTSKRKQTSSPSSSTAKRSTRSG